jgi:hypothetical protein
MKILGLDRPWQILAGDFLMLPLNYFLELGFFFVVYNRIKARHIPWKITHNFA